MYRRKIAGLLGGTIILSVLAATCIAYFVVIVDPVTKEGSGKYVVIIKLGTTTRIIMMNKIPDSTNMII